MKKIFALLITAALLCGCSAKELTAQEYYDASKEIFSRYAKQVSGFTVYVVDYQEGNEISESEIKSFSENTKNALDELAELNPPKEYAAQHKKLCDSIKNEKKWVNAAKDYLTGKKTVKELEEAVTDFAEVYLETVIALKDSGEVS